LPVSGFSFRRSGFPVARGAVFVARQFEPPGGIEYGLSDPRLGVQIAVFVLELELLGEFPTLPKHVVGIFIGI
jgi:hypothetical protein